MKSLFLWLAFAGVSLQAAELSNQEALEIGQRIWKNECAGTISGLTSWNKSEEFPSLGIAHFIWYPAGQRGPFEESFPGLMRFLQRHSQSVKQWMLGSCPWKSRSEFLADRNGPMLTELRKILADTIPFQARYAALRLDSALPKMLAATPEDQRARVADNFHQVAAAPLGYYALIDYVNFKGEGTNPSERYHQDGWGLLQVLLEMKSSQSVMVEFVSAANHVLTRRVQNAPLSRHEEQWLPGWRNRLQTYLP